MGNSEIKPVIVDHTVALHIACELYGRRYGIDWIWHHDGIGLLHPQSTIERLEDERDAASYDAGTNSGVVQTLKQERLQLIAERDAAVADAKLYRAVIEYALSQHNYGCLPLQNHWAAKAMSDLAEIDAARIKNKEQANG